MKTDKTPPTKPTGPELKTNNRFVVKFCEEVGIPSYVVKGLTFPQYVDGEWQAMSFTLWDPVGPSTTRSLYKLIGREPSNGELEVKISYLDPVGAKVGTWRITFEEVKCVDFGAMDWERGAGLELFVIIDPISVTLD